MNRRSLLGRSLGGFFAALLPWEKTGHVEVITDQDRADIMETRIIKGAVKLYDEEGNCFMIVRPLWK